MNNNCDKSTYFLIIVIIILVSYYQCKKMINEKMSQHKIEHFQNNKTNINNNSLYGSVVNTNEIPANSMLPRNTNNISSYKVSGDFSNSLNNNTDNKSNTQSKFDKLFLDNSSDGLVLLPQGYLIIDLEENVDIHSLLMKGFKTCRVDLAKKGSKEYKQILNVKNPDKLLNSVLHYSKENINQNNNTNPHNKLEGTSIKITNTNNQMTKPIKLEILEFVNKTLKINTSKNIIKNIQITDQNNNKVSNLLITNKNNKDAHLKIKLPTNNLVTGIKLRTNIPHFKLGVSGNKLETFPKKGLYEGGIDGIKQNNFYFPFPVLTKNIQIIPFINNNTINDKKYFIDNVQVHGNTSNIPISDNNHNNTHNNTHNNHNNDNDNDNIIEAFQSQDDDVSNSGSSNAVLLADLQNSIDIQKACQSLSYQEDINNEAHKLEQFKKYNLILEQQHDEYKNLERIVNDLRDKRHKQLAKEDLINVSKYQKLRGEEVQVKEALLKTNKKKSRVNINYNLTKHNFDNNNSNAYVRSEPPSTLNQEYVPEEQESIPDPLYNP